MAFPHPTYLSRHSCGTGRTTVYNHGVRNVHGIHRVGGFDCQVWLSLAVREAKAVAKETRQPKVRRAQLPQNRREQLLRAFFHCYSKHEPFRRALSTLASDTAATIMEVEEFLKAWRLDRIPEGPGALLTWLGLHRLSPAATPIGSFGANVVVMGEIPPDRIDDRIHLAPMTDEEAKCWDDARWHVLESRAEVRERLIARLDSELDRIERTRKDMGYDFPDDPHQRDQHATWTFERFVLGCRPRDDENRRKVTTRLGKELGLRT